MARESFYDQILDEVMPGDLDWRGLVVDYPLAAMTLSLAGGFWLGRAHGSAVLSGLTAFAVREVSQNVQSFVGGLGGQGRDRDPYEDDFADESFSDDDDFEDGAV